MLEKILELYKIQVENSFVDAQGGKQNKEGLKWKMLKMVVEREQLKGGEDYVMCL